MVQLLEVPPGHWWSLPGTSIFGSPDMLWQAMIKGSGPVGSGLKLHAGALPV